MSSANAGSRALGKEDESCTNAGKMPASPEGTPGKMPALPVDQFLLGGRSLRGDGRGRKIVPTLCPSAQQVDHEEGDGRSGEGEATQNASDGPPGGARSHRDDVVAGAEKQDEHEHEGGASNHSDFDNYPVNFLVGKGVSMEGTIGHVKSALDSMVRRGELNQVIWLNGTPTIMIGETDGPNFEEHLKQGPYLVFDDAAKPQYKNDPCVTFVPGRPVLRTAMPNLMVGLGARIPGNAILQWQQFQRWGMSNMRYGTPRRKAVTIAETLGGVAAVGGAIALLVKGAVKLGKAARMW